MSPHQLRNQVKMKAKIALCLASAIVFAVVTGQGAYADNKLADGAKAVGRGIMWVPKKLWQGCKANKPSLDFSC